MTLVEVIGNQYLRILALEETVGKLQTDNSLLQEKVMKLTPETSKPAITDPVEESLGKRSA